MALQTLQHALLQLPGLAKRKSRKCVPQFHTSICFYFLLIVGCLINVQESGAGIISVVESRIRNAEVTEHFLFLRFQANLSIAEQVVVIVVGNNW